VAKFVLAQASISKHTYSAISNIVKAWLFVPIKVSLFSLPQLRT